MVRTFCILTALAVAFTFATSATAAFGSVIAIADMNGDGIPDLVTAENGAVGVCLGDGAGGFPNAGFQGEAPSTISLAIADLNGDGQLDVIMASKPDDGQQNISVRFGNGNGTLDPR